MSYIGNKNSVALYDSFTKEQSEDNFAPITRSRKNLLINGGFDIWQRGTSINGSSYTADRWSVFVQSGAGTTQRREFDTGQTDVAGNPSFYFRHSRTTPASAANIIIQQRVEGVRTLEGKLVTLSFFAKCSKVKDVDVSITQKFGTGGTPSNNVSVTSPITVGTSWQKYSVTLQMPSLAGKTIGTDGNDHIEAKVVEVTGFENFFFDIAQVQLEAGDTATDFEYRPIGEELALCQRYFQRYRVGSNEEGNVATVFAIEPGLIRGIQKFITPFRAAPSVEVINSGSLEFIGHGTNVSLTNGGIASPTVNGFLWNAGCNTTEVGNVGYLRLIAGQPTPEIRADAEL